MTSFGGLSNTSPPMSHQDVLDSAGRMIDKHLQDDRTSLDLSEQLRVPIHTQPSVSGLHDYDYPSLVETGFGNDILSEISRVDRYPLPPELVEQFGRVQCSCTMGLFMEIERAWLSVDSDIFVWKYENGGDLAYFDGMNETILATSLVKPKSGIFQPNIKFLLVLASPIEIAILGVSFASTQSKYDEMHLLPEPLFSIPTDNVYAMTIVGTQTGRIFMGGKDGCLYEVFYQADGWFGRKCRLINHSKGTLSYFMPSFLSFSFSEQDAMDQIAVDDSRNILYCRTQKGSILVYDLGKDGKGLGKVAAIPLQNTVYNASHVARTIDRSQFKSLVHISPITKMESSNVHLVAITDTGVRLYFTTNPFGTSTGRPNMLTLVHVRLPPGFLTTATPQKPNNVHMAYHKEGSMVLLGSQAENADLMWVVSGDTFPFQNQLMESYTTVPISGRAWAISEVDYFDLKPLSERAEHSTGRDPPCVVTQHAKPLRKFVILNSQGSHIFSKLRPVDQLRQLLIDCQGPDAEEVKAFFRVHKTEQACATCLILACSRLATEQNVADWAKMAFFLYGGEAQYTYGAGGLSGDRPLMPANITSPGGGFGAGNLYTSNLGQTGQQFSFHSPIQGIHPAQTSTPMPYGQHAMYGHPMGGMPSFAQEITFSGKHNGICLYLSRILRSLWDTMIVTEFPFQTPEGTVNYLTSTFSDHELGFVLDHVRQLSDFVDFNSKFDSGPTDTGSKATLKKRKATLKALENDIIWALSEVSKSNFHTEEESDTLKESERDLATPLVNSDTDDKVFSDTDISKDQNQGSNFHTEEESDTLKESERDLATPLINSDTDDKVFSDTDISKDQNQGSSLHTYEGSDTLTESEQYLSTPVVISETEDQAISDTDLPEDSNNRFSSDYDNDDSLDEDYNPSGSESDEEGIGSVPFTPHIMGHVDEQTRRKLQIEAQKMEKVSLQNIQDLIHRVEEVLGLLKVLVENKLYLLTAMLTKDQQNQLRSMTFKQFVITGKEMCGILIQCLVNGYLNDNASTDAISTKLREVCPSLYSPDDATCSKANEMLQAAKLCQNPSERRQFLNEALKLYRTVSHPLQLSEICNQFASVHFYEGIVDLCLTIAKKRDPQRLALHFYNNDEPPEDMQGVQELMQRKDCYKCITETLGYLMTASVPQGAAAIPKSPGPPPAPDSSRMSAEDAEHYKEEVFGLALKSDDELFHVSLYDWMFSMNLTEKLLTVQSPFLEPYLKRRACYQSGDISALDLLWKYYEKTENYPAAARILSRLAERHGTDIDLQKRIVFLSCAIMCAKSATSRSSSAQEGEFLHELEEKMEVARLQKSVLQALSQEPRRPGVKEAIVRLESDLLDITMLYEDFADEFDLHECRLAICHCGNITDSALVENLWQNIIDKEIEHNRSSAPSVRERNISNKLSAIGKTYIKTERYFPVAFLVKYLEQRGCENNLQAGWVHQLMLEIGVPALKLLELYDRMFKSRDPFWASVNKPLHLLFAIHSLLNKLVGNLTLIPVYERRQFSTMGLDYISCYLVELQSIGSVADPNVRVLMNNFKSLKAKVERI